MRLLVTVLLYLGIVGHASAQEPCDAGTAMARAYRIRSVRIEQPFVLVPVLRTRLQALEKTLNGRYANTVYANSKESAAAGEIRAALDPIAIPLEATKLRIVVGRIQNCTSGQVDVLFTVVYIAIPTRRPSIPELGAQMFSFPASVAVGQDKGLKLLPLAGYDASGGLRGGGRISKKLATQGCSSALPTYFDASGLGGSQSHTVLLRVGGECAKVNYRELAASFQSDVLPTQVAGVNTTIGQIYYHRDLKPLKPAGLTLRFGTAISGGSYTDGSLGAQITTSSVVGLKGAIGLAYVFGPHAIEVAVGEELGRNVSAGQVFGKQLIDLRHQLWLPYGDHRDFEAESEFHAGTLFNATDVPLAGTFLLNSSETNFLPSTNWSISSAPSIRSVSSKRNVTLASTGGKSYIAANTLLGVNVFRVPLVPTSLTSEQEFKKAVASGEESALSSLIAVYQTQDAHIDVIAQSVPALVTAGQQLTSYLSQSSVQSHFPDDAADCQANMQTLQAIDLQPLTVQPNVGIIQDLVDPSDGFLAATLQSCRDTLGAELQDPAFNAITNTMQQWQVRATEEYQLVDTAAAKKKAQLIMAEVTPVFATLTGQVNTTSLTPMVALDYLRLVPRGGASAVTLLGVGPAIRLTLVSSVNFTVGYSFNVMNRSQSGPGGFFGGITFHDFLHF